MAKLFLLGGGSEFQKDQEAADRHALEQANGPVLLVATDSQTLQKGQQWFGQTLGASQVQTYLPGQADQPDWETTRLLYLTDGEPGTYVDEAWLWQADTAESVVAGSGGGAMALGASFYDSANDTLLPGRGLLPEIVIVPYFNTHGRKWADKILALNVPPYLLGLDERVAVIGHGNDWQVYGRGWITLYRQGKPAKFQGGQPFKLEV